MVCTSAGAEQPTGLRDSLDNLYEMYGSVQNILVFVCQVIVFHGSLSVTVTPSYL